MTSRRLSSIGCVVCAVLLSPGPAVAQPAITGTSQQTGTSGPVLVVSGSRFGVHANHNATGTGSLLSAAWQNFESGQLSGGNLQLENISTAQWSVQSTGARPNSQYFAKKVYINNRLGELNLTQANTTGRWFISFWFRVQDVASQQSGKFFRIWGDNANVYLSTGAGNLQIRGYSECTSCTPAPTTVWGSPDSLVADQWQRVDIQIAQSPDLFAVYLDGKLEWRRSSALSGAEMQKWIPNPLGANGHTVGVGGMIDSAGEGWPANGSYKFDDVFIDYTWARVELGNAPTWAACTRREIQPPRQWSDTQITVQLNKGAFATGQTVYAYVVDANGAVNASGVPVVIGASATAPKAPVNLRIVR
jgi:hypothetical protein